MVKSSKKKRFSTELRRHEEVPIAQISAKIMRQDLSASVKNQRKELDLTTSKKMIFKTKTPHRLVAAHESNALVSLLMTIKMLPLLMSQSFSVRAPI